MGEETFRAHLNSLQELILDEEKLVTYVSISKDFCIHVNESKCLMNEVVSQIRKKEPNTILNILYVVSGITEDKKAVTCVCTESDLNDWRKKMRPLFFEHVYSINKGNPSVDIVALLAITKFDDYHLCSGLIKSNLCLKRSSEEINNLKSKSNVVLENDQKSSKFIKKNKEDKPNDVVMNENTVAEKPLEVKSASIVKQEKISPKKEVSNKQKQETKNGGKPQKGITGFFSRSGSASDTKTSVKNNKNDESQAKIKVEAVDNNKTVKLEKMDVDDNISDSQEMKSDKNHGKTTMPINGTTEKKSKSNKSLNQIKKNAKVDKKRKRVLHVSDSDSDEEKIDPFVEEADVHNEQINFDSEDEIPPTPAVNTVKITSGILNPKKRRKIINKTYTDEDGYILTKKEEVYESMSESEDTKENMQTDVKKETDDLPKKLPNKIEISPKNKKNGVKNNKKKISPPQKGKQATLMSFFKKA